MVVKSTQVMKEASEKRCICQGKSNRNVSYMLKDGKAGVVNERGEFVIPPKFCIINELPNGGYECIGFECDNEFREVYNAEFERTE